MKWNCALSGRVDYHTVDLQQHSLGIQNGGSVRTK